MGATLAEVRPNQANAGIAELHDRIMIQDLVNRYAHYIRNQDVEGVLALFTEDATVDFDRSAVDNGGCRRGKAELRPVYEAGFRSMAPWPIMVNHIADFDGPDRAHGTVCIELRQGALGYQVTWIGTYDDIYVKQGNTWKFQSRVTEVRHVTTPDR
jgi:ketosteroid isomerase-like protein